MVKVNLKKKKEKKEFQTIKDFYYAAYYFFLLHPVTLIVISWFSLFWFILVIVNWLRSFLFTFVFFFFGNVFLKYIIEGETSPWAHLSCRLVFHNFIFMILSEHLFQIFSLYPTSILNVFFMFYSLFLYIIIYVVSKYKHVNIYLNMMNITSIKGLSSKMISILINVN